MRTITTCISNNKDFYGKNSSYTLLDTEATLTVIKNNILKEKMINGEIYVNNLRIDKAGRIIKVENVPYTVNCISIKRQKNGKIESYTLIDEYKCLSVLTPDELKGCLYINNLIITNLQIDKLGRLVKKQHQPSELELKIVGFKYLIEEELLKGNKASIPKYEKEDEYIDTEEMKLYLPEYMINPIRGILGLSLSRRNISILLQAIVPDVLQEVKRNEKCLVTHTVFCKDIEIENYTLV